MAVTGNKSGSFNGQYPSYATPYIFWSYEQSISNNNTVLTAELKVKREKTGTTTYKATTPWSMTIGGTKTSGNVNFKITNVSAGEYITIGKASKTFIHKDDGSIDAIAVSATIDLSGTTLGAGSVSASIPINTIPRASEPTFSISGVKVTSVAMGSSVTINTNRKSDSFTHTLTYKFGNASGTIGSGVGANTTWTPPIDLAKQIPNGSEGTCTITCQTYNASELVGTKTTTLNLTVPDTVKPVINAVNISEGNSVVPSSWGVYVKGKSALKVDINASGVYGSSITGYKITGIDSITYNESSFTSAVLQEEKTYTVKVVVTDSRGRTAESEKQVVCVSYNNPLISVATVTRCNADGSTNAKGTSVKYTFKASVSPVNNKNTYAYKLGYKKSKDDYFTYIDIPNNSYTLDKTNVVISDITFSSSSTYVFDFHVYDYFTDTSNTSNSIKSGFKLINFNKSGKGMAFGKFSEKDALEVDMDMYYKGEHIPNIFYNKYLGTGINLNDITTPGQYGIYGTNTNCPTTGIAVLEVVKYSPDWIIQRVTTVEATPIVYERCYHSGNTWSAWIKQPSCDGNGSLTVKANLVAGYHLKANDGYLYSTANGNTVSIGSQNANYCHIYNSANIPFYFNRDILVNGYRAETRTALYGNSSGTTGTVTLSMSVSNFLYLDIYYKNADGQYGSTRVYGLEGGKTTYGTIIRTTSSGDTLLVNSALFTISGTTISISRNMQGNMVFGGSNNKDNNTLAITSVFGVY